MVNILQSLSKTIHLSAILAILLFAGLFFAGGEWAFDRFFGVGYLDISCCCWNNVDWIVVVSKLCSNTKYA